MHWRVWGEGKHMRRVLKWITGIVVLPPIALVLLWAVTINRGDPHLYPQRDGNLATDTGIVVHVVDHGYHAGLVLPRQALADVAQDLGNAALIELTQHFRDYELLEVGWGEDHFYRNVASASLANTPHIIRALLRPGNKSVLHIVGLSMTPEAAFPASDRLELRLGARGFRKLSQMLGDTFATSNGSIIDGGSGLYGPSRFFAANGSYHLLNLCNHWTGQALREAGVPYSPVLATLSAGLMLDLRWRAVP
jgi:uncharacterized protein (TIGR02117 family)